MRAIIQESKGNAFNLLGYFGFGPQNFERLGIDLVADNLPTKNRKNAFHFTHFMVSTSSEILGVFQCSAESSRRSCQPQLWRL